MKLPKDLKMQVEEKKVVVAPPRFQDQLMIVCTHTADNKISFQLDCTRVHLVDATGNPLPQPIGEKLDEITAFSEIMEACQQRLIRALYDQEQAQKEAPTSSILRP